MSRGRLVAVLGALHVAGFGLLLASAGTGLGIGVGLTAYALGARHAFDVDHIAAIDNATRRLVSTGRHPASAGCCFALGHSTVVLLLSLLVALGVRGAAASDTSVAHVAGVIGPIVSGALLVMLATLNAGALLAGAPGRGLIARALARPLDAVRSPWQMYPLGLLFGLGFDTATEVALLALAGGSAAGGVPLGALVCLPLLFAAGMALCDTLDSVLATRAYRWGSARRRRYDVVLTGLSVSVALGVGMSELLAPGTNLALIGPAIVVAFAAAWTLAVVADRVTPLPHPANRSTS